MRCFFTFTLAAVLAVGMHATSWSQTGGASGATGSAGTSGAAGTAGTAGATGTAGAAGTTGAAGGNVGVGTTGTGNTGIAGSTPAATNRVSPGNVGTATGPGAAGAAGVGRANVNNNAINANAAARNVNGQDFQFPNQNPFFSDPGVRQQLNINDRQFNTLNTAYQDAYARYNQAVNNLSPSLTPEQREMQLQRLQQQFNQGLAGISGSTLTNPQTLNRFNQLNRQFSGPNAFNDPSIRQQLNLNAAQVRQLRTLQNNWRQQMRQFQQTTGQDSSGTNDTQWTQLQQQYSASLNSILTPEQQQMWAQQVGQPYPVSPGAFMNRRRPDGNVGLARPSGAGVQSSQLNATGGTPAAGLQPTTVAPGSTATQVPAGTQPATQGTTAPATASGTSTQGGTVR